MFVTVRGLANMCRIADGRARHVRMALGAALAAAWTSGLAHGQTAGSPPPGYTQPAAPPGSAGPSSYPPQSYGPSGYPAQQGYPQNYGQAQPPPAQPSYGQQGQAPPTQPPSYGSPPGYRGYTEPPLPPPPKRIELEWSIRFQLLNLLFGRVTGEVEYAFAGPFSVVLLPEYVFNQPINNRPVGVSGKGAGIAAQFGYWVEGRPLRGYFLKAHAGYRSITVKGPYDELAIPATELGAMFGSQSVYGGWFTLSGGFGVVYDFQSQDRAFIMGYDSSGRPVGVIQASGLFGNGFDLLGQLSIGGSF